MTSSGKKKQQTMAEQILLHLAALGANRKVMKRALIHTTIPFICTAVWREEREKERQRPGDRQRKRQRVKQRDRK